MKLTFRTLRYALIVVVASAGILISACSTSRAQDLPAPRDTPAKESSPQLGEFGSPEDLDLPVDQKSILAKTSKFERVPLVDNGRFVLPKLIAATTETKDIGNGRTPEGFRGEDNPPTETLPESGRQRDEGWGWTIGQWAAANTFSYPRYFEDRMLERHGHERCPRLQPLVSGARFVATVPMLPYLMTVRPPCDCESTLGYYRSGSCAPPLLQRPPCERTATVVEAAAIAGAIIAFP